MEGADTLEVTFWLRQACVSGQQAYRFLVLEQNAKLKAHGKIQTFLTIRRFIYKAYEYMQCSTEVVIYVGGVHLPVKI